MNETTETQTETDTKLPDQTPPSAASLQAGLEAALISTDRPLATGRLAELLSAQPKDIEQAIESLNANYTETGRSFRVEKLADGYQILTLPDYAGILEQARKQRTETRLSAAAIETLAIVAYRQPVLRVDIEAVRGVASGEVLRSLMDMQLVRIAGRAETLGRPMLYGTTKRFLELFGLASLKDLPDVEGNRKESNE